jgi:YidC/Oxa1 family membrane protein insertase
MDFQRSLLLGIFVLSGFFLFQAWQKENVPIKPPTAATAAAEKKSDIPSAGNASAASGTSTPGTAAPAAGVAPANAAVSDAGEIITVTTDLGEYKINTKGGVIEEVGLKEHRDGADKSKPYYVLMKTKDRSHVAQTGLIGTGLPNHNTLYSKAASNFDMGSNATLEVRLSAPLAGGGKNDLVYNFKRGSYLVDVSHEITNGGAASIAPTAYFHFNRDSKITGATNPIAPSAITGPAFYTEKDKYKQVKFDALEKGKKNLFPAEASDGWVAMVEHYFVNAWIPKAGTKRKNYASKEDGDAYRAGVKLAAGDIAPGATGKVTVPLYMGPQDQDVLAALSPGLDIVVDYGMFSFIAKPMFALLQWLHNLVGNWGWAIVLLTVLVKAAFYPLNAAAGRSMGKMKLVGPKMKEIQERFGSDKMKQQQAMMELYKKEKINPLGGCLPILVQIPVFFALFTVLTAAVELRHAPWIGWIQDLSAPDPWFILPILYIISAFFMSKLNPPAPGMDPMQQKMLQYMPVAFGVMFVFFASGLVLYWTVSNILQIAQQWQINRMLEKEQAAAQALVKR